MFGLSISAFISTFGALADIFLFLLNSFFPGITPENISYPSSLIFISGLSNLIFLFPDFNSIFGELTDISGIF